MRDYGIVSPQFWIGDTGKSLRGNPSLQVAALYLMTSPHANMIGVYYCPLDYIGKETGLGLEGASKSLRSLQEGGFCSFSEQSEEVFVHRMAAFQIGAQLDPKDNRCKGVARELEKVVSAELRQAFRAIYSVAFNLPVDAPKKVAKASPSKAPSKPGSGSGSGSGNKGGDEGRFPAFWTAWPKSERKQDRKACLEKWQREGLDDCADAILADVALKSASRKWQDDAGKYIEAPLVYLNNRRWEDGAGAANDSAPALLAGAM